MSYLIAGLLVSIIGGLIANGLFKYKPKVNNDLKFTVYSDNDIVNLYIDSLPLSEYKYLAKLVANRGLTILYLKDKMTKEGFNTDFRRVSITAMLPESGEHTMELSYV